MTAHLFDDLLPFVEAEAALFDGNLNPAIACILRTKCSFAQGPDIATRVKLDPTDWHLHRFRDIAATRWLRAGIDVRTVQVWLGHESLATTQKYLEQLELPFKQKGQRKRPTPQVGGVSQHILNALRLVAGA